MVSVVVARFRVRVRVVAMARSRSSSRSRQLLQRPLSTTATTQGTAILFKSVRVNYYYISLDIAIMD